MRNLLGVFFVCFLLFDLVGPNFAGLPLVDLSLILFFSWYFWTLVNKRCFLKGLKIIRWLLWGGCQVYLVALLIELVKSPDMLLQHPGAQFHAIVEAWLILGLVFMGATSPRVVRFFSNIQNNPAQFIALTYFGVALGAALLLILPISLNYGRELSPLNALFTTISAISGTGLVVVNTATTFSMFGKFIILIVIQAGGIGIITFGGALLLSIGKELGLNERVLQDTTERLHFLGDLRSFFKLVAIVVFSIEIVGAILLLPWHLSIIQNPFDAAFQSLFHSISAFCTAGFSTLEQGMFAARQSYSTLLTIGGLSVLGMLGIPTIVNILELLKKKQGYHKLSANSKLELLVNSGVLIFGLLSIFIVEFMNPIYNSTADQFMQALFHSSQRSAGFNSMDIASYTLPSIFILVSLMAIGSAPMSTGGGVRTSSIGLFIVFVISFLRGQTEASFAGRRIPLFIFLKAASLIFLHFSILFFGFIALVLTQKAPPLDLLFEATSALSLTGLTLGATASLDSIGKWILIFLMLIGRIGILTGIYALIRSRRPARFRYPQGEFYVG
ncbi:MAG: hypothetical protein COV44_02415 [Deltaproteobacteria bacterium CG11_big_fil_rev_8_21_14_0_20_45_16]|nr:MAG: hypothetical protein COV44_02415 [Deltaproteobacteria bacterium CG11_big_fil_rev_8_21_14_0_20_45_16]